MGFGEPIDLSPVLDRPDGPAAGRVAAEIDRACGEYGFFTIVGHGVEKTLRRRLEEVSQEFFALDEEEKSRISMTRGGRAWRGWFPPGGELTSGRPDSKEGIYFGVDLPADDPRVLAGRPLHGPNLWPRRPREMREVVGEWMAEMERVSRAVLGAMAMGMGLDRHWFDDDLTADPVVLFRIFHYLPAPEDPSAWGVGEHTDYGLLTLLAQDDVGGLEVRVDRRWRTVAPDPDALVCNIGDMLDRMTGGRYRSTLHRVRPPVGRSRLSFPFFFDPGWDVEVRPVPSAVDVSDGDSVRVGPRPQRWDGTDLDRLSGTYGEYLTLKVARVFPELAERSVSQGSAPGSPAPQD